MWNAGCGRCDGDAASRASGSGDNTRLHPTDRCSIARLEIELDGPQRYEDRQQHVLERCEHLRAEGIGAMRFSNRRFLEEPTAVLEVILAAGERRAQKGRSGT